MDDVIVQKTKSIEKCVARVEEEYRLAGESFYEDFTRQDAAILNLQRACENCIDLANHVIRKNKLGVPESSRGSFDLLIQNEIIDET